MDKLHYGISVYRDKKGIILLIPHAFDENGVRRGTPRFTPIESPYDKFTIGRKIIESFRVTINNPYQKAVDAVRTHEIATGIKSYKAFSKNRIMIAASFEKENGYTFTPWKRFHDGSYGLDKDDPKIEFKAGIDASEEEIGDLVLRAFDSVAQL